MGKRRKILFVSSNFPPVIGGSAVVYDQICRNAADDVIAVGSRHNLFTNKIFAGLKEFDASCPYTIVRRNYLRPPILPQESRKLHQIYRLIFVDLPVMVGTLAFLTFLILRHRIKVVCLGELVYSGWLVFPLRYLLRRKVIIYTHGEEVSQEPDCALARVRWLFLRHADAIVAVSLFCKSQIVSLYGVDARRVFVIPNGVDLELFHRGAADPDVLPSALRGHPIVLSVSRLVVRKGVDALIKAFPGVLAARPETRCVIVGTGPLAEPLQHLVRDMGLEGKVVFLGSVPGENLARLYRTCDVFALPCRTLPDGDTEGFGLVFLEANACGMPVVAGAAGGTVEAVLDGETGLIVDGYDHGQITDALLRLLSDRDLAQRLGQTGWQRAQEWGWPQVANLFTSLCHAQPWRTNVKGVYPTVASAPLEPLEPLRAGDRSAPPRLLVTVDVEEEFDWNHFSRDGFRVRGADALEAFHQTCAGIGISPVYLATHAMLEDPAFSAFFARVMDEGSGEVGIHLHTWTTPPFWEQPNSFNSFQCNLPLHIERAKIAHMCRTYEDRFGRAVPFLRAGRWGGSSQTSVILEEMGIPVDFSPSTGFAEPQTGGPDFRNLDGWPFWAGPTGSVLTLPASAVKYLRGPKWISSLAFLLRPSCSFLQYLGKSARLSTESQSIESIETMFRQFHLHRQPVVVSSLHSTSLYPGGSPYTRTPELAAAVHANTLAFLNYSVKTNLLRPSTTAEVLEAARRAKERAETGTTAGGTPSRLSPQ